MNKTICIAFLHFMLIVHSFSLFAQNKLGAPFIQNYTTKEYNASAQNWAIVQDNRGVMYFGNNDGVLEYDGTNWRLIKVTNNSLVRSLAIDSTGTIYVGAVGEFGYLAPDSIGNMQYLSLIMHLDSANRKFADVWQTHTFRKWIYFNTRTAFYAYDPNWLNKGAVNNDNDTVISKDLHFKIWKPQQSFSRSSIVFDEFYIRQRKVGLMQMINDSLHLIEEGAEKKISVMFPYYDDQILIPTNFEGIYIYNPQNQKSNRFSKPESFKEIDAFLSKNRLYGGCILHENIFALATKCKGIAIIDANGKIIELINKKTGLLDDNVRNIYYNNQDLWLALNNGISHVEWSSPLRLWDEHTGLQGYILDIIRYRGALFVSTFHGVYYLENNHFKAIENIKAESWCFLSYSPPDSPDSPLLLIGTKQGIYEINGSLKKGFSAHLVRESTVVFKLYNSKKNTHKIFAGFITGLAIIQYENGVWKDLGKVNGIEEEVLNLAEDIDGNIWLGTRYNGVIRLSPDKETNTEYKISRYDTASGLPVMKEINIYNFENDLLFATNQGFYRFDKTRNFFIPDSSLGKEFADGSTGIYSFVEDHNRNCWIGANSKKRFTEILIKQDDNSYRRDTLPFKRIPYMEVEAIYPEPDGITWFGGSDGLYSYDSNKKTNYNKTYKTIIRKVTVRNDSVVFLGSGYGSSGYKTRANINGLKNNKELILLYKDNSIIFNYSALYFSPEETNLYSYYLEGYDPGYSGWSGWSKETKKEYTNLHEGNYSFKVKAKNVYEKESTIAIYSFTVLPPWYRTILAYIMYFIFLILIIFLGIRINTRRLKAANLRLEKIVKERTAEIVKQNIELEKQKEEINTQKNEIEKQRDIVIQQKDEITDSIIYAKRIQSAVLPPDDLVTRNLSQCFIMFKPRDIVSGDFYWIKKIDNYLIITVADCTGHGVPGAFMSMLGIALLNDIVRYKEISTASQALNELRNQIKAALRQSGKEGEAEDGIDMALCVIDFENMKMQFAGARNPLYIIRNNELIIVKADKMPIGIYLAEKKSFTNHTMKIHKNDCYYMFSDGFIDQFGGKENKRYTSKQFKDLLREIHKKPMPEQKTILNKTLTNWMDDEEQIDDITIVGFRI